MRDPLKSFYFRKKSRCAKRDFLFFYQIVIETYFYERILVENLYESQFRRLRDENIVRLAFEFVLNKYQSGWWVTSHSA